MESANAIAFNESEYDRVSSVLYAFSELRFVDKFKVDNASKRGTVVHNLCDAIIDDMDFFERLEMMETQTKAYTLNSDHYKNEILLIEGFMQSFTMWWEDVKPIALPKVPRLYCHDLKITGEIDRIFQIGDLFYLMDFKTPAQKSISWQQQLSAYMYLCEKNNIELDHIYVLKLLRTGKMAQEIRYEPIFNEFLHSLHAYRYWHKDKAKIIELDHI